MITLVVKYVFRTGSEDEAEAYIRKLIAATRQEPGCRTYSVNRSLERARTYLFFEQYDDQAALDAHRASPYFLEFGKNGIQTIAESRDASTYEPLE
jgi:quinol monooxygenase YgiN